MRANKPKVRSVSCGYKGRNRCWGWYCDKPHVVRQGQDHYNTQQAALEAALRHVRMTHARG